ncbi:hypothetical protein GCK72_023668 [Caenorhabditis remanei]|uniref:CUT domain-containing protein n=1 Tax=Caenorhabditis remanei TaxID=31234 RepID=A0A6A5FXG2_CAERE|nr:hypothetical protein GCK72_023668 [Caenorhabditis remanei]KAF1747207.1 hypothetical protein GCK72_023668 [Caenorhabditis remanei]
MFEEDYSSDILQALTNEFVKDLPSDFLQKLENIDHIDISTALNEVDSSEFHSHSIDSSTRPAGATDLYALSESEAYQVSSRSDVHTIPQELPITERYNKECHCFDCQNAFAQFNVKIPAIPCLPSAVTDNRTFIPSTQNRWNTTFEFSTFNRSPILAVPNNLKLNTKYNNFKPEDFSAHPQTLKEATKMLTAEIPEGVKVNTEYISKTMREWLWVSKISKDTFITNILECNSTTYTRYLHLPPSFEEMDKFSYQRELYRVLYNWISFPEEVKHQIIKLKILDQR